MKGIKALLVENEARGKWHADDAEDRATAVWLAGVLGRWLLAQSFFEKLCVCNEYISAFRVEAEERELIEDLIGFRVGMQKLCSRKAPYYY